MISCDEFVAQVSDYLDGRVPFGERIGVCMHRLMCVRCRNFYRQLKEIVEFVEVNADPPDTGPSEEVRSDLMNQYRERYGS